MGPAVISAAFRVPTKWTLIFQAWTGGMVPGPALLSPKRVLTLLNADGQIEAPTLSEVKAAEGRVASVSPELPFSLPTGPWRSLQSPGPPEAIHPGSQPGRREAISGKLGAQELLGKAIWFPSPKSLGSVPSSCLKPRFWRGSSPCGQFLSGGGAGIPQGVLRGKSFLPGRLQLNE